MSSQPSLQHSRKKDVPQAECLWTALNELQAETEAKSRLKLKPINALDENSSLSYGASPAIRHHTALPATRHKWTRPALTPASKLILDLSTPVGWKAEWPGFLAMNRPGGGNLDHKSDALTTHAWITMQVFAGDLRHESAWTKLIRNGVSQNGMENVATTLHHAQSILQCSVALTVFRINYQLQAKNVAYTMNRLWNVPKTNTFKGGFFHFPSSRILKSDCLKSLISRSYARKHEMHA